MGSQAVFRWIGKDAPGVIGDFDAWGGDAPTAVFERSGGDEWRSSLELRQDAYIEYSFVRDGKRIPDPLNPRRTPNGMGATNQFFTMPDWSESSLTRRRRTVPRGVVSAHLLDNVTLLAGGHRRVWLYQPPVERPCRLLVVLDGQDYLRRGRLVTIVDNLIASGRIEPLVIAMVAHGGQARVIEYASNDATATFIVKHVVPFSRRHANVAEAQSGGQGYGILGASMGGLMALHVGLMYPEVISCVYSQSGAFRLGSLYGRSLLDALIPHLPISPIRVFIEVGFYEGLRGPNRDLYAVLQNRGYDVEFGEHSGGHNWMSWRNRVADGLETLFPGPATTRKYVSPQREVALSRHNSSPPADRTKSNEDDVGPI